MNKHEWSTSDISKIRTYFIAGLSYKDMARELGCSATAINKVLDRFGIRPKLPKEKITIEPRTEKKVELSLTAPSFGRKALQEELDNWVSFFKICDYLSEQKVCFYEVSARGVSIDCRQFKVGTKILSARQLLMLANKMRMENNLKTFFVRGLSW